MSFYLAQSLKDAYTSLEALRFSQMFRYLLRHHARSSWIGMQGWLAVKDQKVVVSWSPTLLARIVPLLFLDKNIQLDFFLVLLTDSN